MRAVVLVGGFGTRLRPLTLDVPKQMLPVAGITMFERVVHSLHECGVDEVVVSLGYRPDAFMTAFPDAVCAGVRLNYAVEDSPLDTAGAIRFAALQCGVDDTFLAINGDVLCDVDYSMLVQVHRERGAQASLHLVGVDDPSRFGVVPTDADGRVIEFVEKPAPGTAPTNMINAGAYVLEPSVLDMISSTEPESIERVTFPRLAQAGQLFALGTDDYWIDAGTHESYLRANLDILAGKRGGSVAPTATTSSIAPDVVIANSMIGEACVIEAGCEVVNSVVMSGVTLRRDTTVHDSVIAADSIVEAGCELSDLTVVGFGETVPRGSRLRGELIPPRESWSR